MIDTSKIIRASINGSRYTETAPLWKEHYGIYLKIEGAEYQGQKGATGSKILEDFLLG